MPQFHETPSAPSPLVGHPYAPPVQHPQPQPSNVTPHTTPARATVAPEPATKRRKIHDGVSAPGFSQHRPLQCPFSCPYQVAAVQQIQLIPQQQQMMHSPPAHVPPPQQLIQPPAQQVAPQPPTVVNMEDINPIMGHQQHQQVPTQLAVPQQVPQPVHQVQYQLQQQPAAAAPFSQAAPHQRRHQPRISSDVNRNNARQASDREQVLRQRLLLLQHAATCQHGHGLCPKTPHCADMKRLWKHIAECKDQKCSVPHCDSSRYILSHYDRCKDDRCPACGPVREAIHRSY